MVECLACEAGDRIKPRVERGFASETLGNQFKTEIRACEAGDRIRNRSAAARFAGWETFLIVYLGFREQARSTLGFMRSPASQAQKTTFCAKP